jgi:hypothetical protein
MNKSLLAGCALVAASASPVWAAPLLTLADNPTWIRTAGAVGETVITTGDNQRGLAYNPVTANLYVADRASGGQIKVLNSLTGAQSGALNTTGLTGGAIVLTKVGVSDDGAIYATNLSTDGGGASPYKIYRWANEADALVNPPTVVFDSTVAGNALRAGYRYGDNFDIRGGGLNTEILIGAGSTAQVPELMTMTWNGSGLTVDRGLIGNLPPNGGSRLGVAFGEGNDAWSKGSTPLLYSTYTTGPLTPTLVASTPTSVVPSAGFPIDYDPVNNLFAIIDTGAAHTVRLFDVPDPTLPLTGADQIALRAFGTVNANANGAGQAVFGAGFLFVLDTNNALAAYQLVPIPEPTTVGLAGAGVFLLLGRRRR